MTKKSSDSRARYWEAKAKAQEAAMMDVIDLLAELACICQVGAQRIGWALNAEFCTEAVEMERRINRAASRLGRPGLRETA